jgi:hypothetical protein
MEALVGEANGSSLGLTLLIRCLEMQDTPTWWSSGAGCRWGALQLVCNNFFFNNESSFGKKILCRPAANQHICSPSQFLSLGSLSISQFFKTHPLSRKKVRWHLKIMRWYKHVDLQQDYINFFKKEFYAALFIANFTARWWARVDLCERKQFLRLKIHPNKLILRQYSSSVRASWMTRKDGKQQVAASQHRFQTPQRK